MRIKKGFTLIELMVIVAIIGLLMAIVLAIWAISAQNKAAINGYKTSMNSVRTAMELCVGGGDAYSGGQKSAPICNPDNGSKYPSFSSKCGNDPYFCATGSGDNWAITTRTDSSCVTPWDCRGCRLICNVVACSPAPGSSCN